MFFVVFWLTDIFLQPLTLQEYVYLSSLAEGSSSSKVKIACKARVATANYPMEEYDNIQATNARGLALCTQFEIRAMLKQEPWVTIDSHSPLRVQRGSIVNIASTCGTNVIPELFPYVVSKHTVMGITKAAGIDHAKDLVRVNAVCPGLVETPMIATRRKQLQHREQEMPTTKSEAWAPANMYNTPLGRLALADEVADTCIFLASSMSSHITASSITVDGGRTAAY
jgi:NAD(P)-dependent dehydrogenase (short-subunit alcohol dehydrogenase family)